MNAQNTDTHRRERKRKKYKKLKKNFYFDIICFLKKISTTQSKCEVQLPSLFYSDQLIDIF